jgi:hypothetical protein
MSVAKCGYCAGMREQQTRSVAATLREADGAAPKNKISPLAISKLNFLSAGEVVFG